MPKSVLHDITTKEHRSIRHVPLPRRGRGAGEIEEDLLYEREELQMEEPSPSSWQRIFLWSIAILFLLLLGFASLTSFTGATVRVTPKHRLVSLDYEFTAGAAEGAKLRFATLPIDETAEVIIPADTTRVVSEKASGTIIIYNNFSDKPQRFVRNTRFETKSGLVYRIGSSVNVPGKTLKEGKTIPGSLEAAVTADSPGADFNIPLSDFTLPGLKSDPARFAGFYARSKTIMNGGFEGTVKIPSDAALLAARNSLRETLGKKIASGKQSSVPSGYILFGGAFTTKYTSLSPEPKDAAMSVVREKATGAAYLFKIDDISKEIALAAILNSGNLPVDIPLLKQLVFEFKEPQSGDPMQAQTIRFTLKGAAQIVWRFDEKRLRFALAGKPKDELTSVLSSFPTIEKADFVVRPFWSRSFPKNPEKVSVEKIQITEP